MPKTPKSREVKRMPDAESLREEYLLWGLSLTPEERFEAGMELSARL